MRTVTIKCDGCDKEASFVPPQEEPKGWATVTLSAANFNVWKSVKINDQKHHPDLCEECQHELARFMNPKNWKRTILAKEDAA